jgi:carboxymethylenebutenolidase
MCHAEAPAESAPPPLPREEVRVPLAGGEELPALLVRPAAGEGPGVLVVPDVYGRSPFYEDLGARLAAAGFTALVVEPFFRQGPLAERSFPAAAARRARLDERQALRDLDAAVAWLAAQPGMGGGAAGSGQARRTGTIGCCMGGTLVLDLAAQRDDLATVCYYGFPAGSRQPAGPNAAPTPLDLADRINGPVLGFWGDQDERVGVENVRRLAAELAARGVAFEHAVYPGLGHGFLAAVGFDPGHEAFAAVDDSWKRTLEFYRHHLSPRRRP